MIRYACLPSLHCLLFNYRLNVMLCFIVLIRLSIICSAAAGICLIILKQTVQYCKSCLILSLHNSYPPVITGLNLKCN